MGELLALGCSVVGCAGSLSLFLMLGGLGCCLVKVLSAMGQFLYYTVTCMVSLDCAKAKLYIVCKQVCCRVVGCLGLLAEEAVVINRLSLSFFGAVEHIDEF